MTFLPPLPRLWRALIAVLLLWIVTTSAVPAQSLIEDPPDEFVVRLLGENDSEVPRPGPLKVLGLDNKPALREDIEAVAFEARSRIRSTTEVDWEGTAFLAWMEDEAAFLAETGHRPEHTPAAANARRRIVWINAGAWRRADPATRLQVMTHELGHLLVGNLPGGRKRLPLWAEEGLVQHLAGEWSFDRSLKISQASLLGQVPALRDLEFQFPDDPDRRTLAYLTSYKAVEQIAQAYGDERGTVTRMLRRLADKEGGPELNERLWNRADRDGWDALLHESLGSRATNLLIVASSGTGLWLIVMFLAAWAWLRKRRLRREAEQREADEEAWAASLTDDDIQEVWGDREDRWKGDQEMPWEKWERLKAEEEGGDYRDR